MRISPTQSTTQSCELCGGDLALNEAALEGCHLRCAAMVRPMQLKAALRTASGPIEGRAELDRIVALPAPARALELLQTREWGEAEVTRSRSATPAQLKRLENAVGFSLPTWLQEYFSKVGGLKVVSATPPRDARPVDCHFCNVDEAAALIESFESDWSDYIPHWEGPQVPKRFVVLEALAEDAGDGVIYDADLGQCVRVFHKVGIDGVVDFFDQILRVLIAPPVAPPGDDHTELAKAMAEDILPIGTIERHYDRLQAQARRPLDATLASSFIRGWSKRPDEVARALRPYLTDLVLSDEELVVIAAGAVMLENEALAEWALRSAKGPLVGLRALLSRGARPIEARFEAFLSKAEPTVK